MSTKLLIVCVATFSNTLVKGANNSLIAYVVSCSIVKGNSVISKQASSNVIS